MYDHLQQDLRYRVDLGRISAKEETYRLTFSATSRDTIGKTPIGRAMINGLSVAAQPGHGTATITFPECDEPGNVTLSLKVDVVNEYFVMAEYSITQFLSYTHSVVTSGKQSLNRLTPEEEPWTKPQ